MSIPSDVANADAVAISQFLQTSGGKALLQALRSRRPTITGHSMEQVALSGAEAKGWEKCIDEILAIAIEREGAQDLGQAQFINPADDNDPKKRPDHKV